ncbi:glycosyltransferase family 39 protein [Streptomyces sp. 549]|uniref:ArnT family glycosyltransferase n=1 Tax=Streptomyces sp. 549 TaxID=3049076 RepID=UPI0024C44D71|nr:glycosyltransferase family 39 protein [Streptomyces sp. 549]MDK1475186.1 glycosyltransferase family 39 protein [Streptomyces sp. 549]
MPIAKPPQGRTMLSVSDGRRTATIPAPRGSRAPRRERLRTAVATRPSLRYWAGLLPVLLVVSAAVRLPSFSRPLWNPDEGFLATQARMLADGGTLYDNVVDRKPPLMPWLYQGAFAVFGDASLWPLKVLAVLSVAATAAILASLARRRWGDRAGVTAGVLCLLASVGLNPEDTQAASFEVFMLPMTAAAVWCADRRRWAAAGLAVAGAVLVKQTGGAVLLPVLYLLWRSVPRGPDRRQAALRTAAGFAAPLLAVAALTGFARCLFWTVTGSGSYASFTGSELHVLGRGLVNTALFTAGAAGLTVPLIAVLRRRTDRRGVLTAELWVWLVASALAVVTGFHFFGHYYLQLLPPLVMLGTGALQLLSADWLRGAVIGSLVSCTLFTGWAATAGTAELDHSQKLAAAVQARTEPDEEVLFWGMHPEHYWFADRKPASRYLTAGLLTNFSGGRNGLNVGERYGVEGSWPTLMAELTTNPPRLIIDDSRGAPYRPSRMPRLTALLKARYERAAVVDGAVIYQRVDPPR